VLRSVKSLIGYKIEATDDVIGKVDNFLFHDSSWIIRYVVVDTGGWHPGRKVLVSAASVRQPVAEARLLRVGLTKDQVKNSPDINMDKPISRQAEIELHEHYDWKPYWIGGGITAPAIDASSEQKRRAAVAAREKVDTSLRGAQEVIGYHIHALDGNIGHVEDFVLEDRNWIIRYLVIDTRNWLPGRSVLIAPQWIEKISWSDSKVWIDLLRDQVKDSPSYDPSAPVNQEYETRLYDFYGRPKYWA
jgi:hypothetical protein